MVNSSCCSRNPVSFLKPDAGDPKSLAIYFVRDGANEARQLVSRPLSRPSPTANLVGIWKGDPLTCEVRSFTFTPVKNVVCRRVFTAERSYMLDAVYVGIIVLFFAGFALYLRACEKL